MATAPLNPNLDLPTSAAAVHDRINKRPRKAGVFVFAALFAVGLVYSLSHLISDLSRVRHPASFAYCWELPYLLRWGLEFVNGFHDTANAVATVIYTHSLDPHVAVAWSGLCNFAGVVLSTGVVAFSIISLLPVELILQVGSGRVSQWSLRY